MDKKGFECSLINTARKFDLKKSEKMIRDVSIYHALLGCSVSRHKCMSSVWSTGPPDVLKGTFHSIHLRPNKKKVGFPVTCPKKSWVSACRQ